MWSSRVSHIYSVRLLLFWLQVPLHLGRACLEALGAPSRHAVFATVSLLKLFLGLASIAGIIR